jgi:hypothetical protein
MIPLLARTAKERRGPRQLTGRVALLQSGRRSIVQGNGSVRFALFGNVLTQNANDADTIFGHTPESTRYITFSHLLTTGDSGRIRTHSLCCARTAIYLFTARQISTANLC